MTIHIHGTRDDFMSFAPIEGTWDAHHPGPDDYDTAAAADIIARLVSIEMGEPCTVTVYGPDGRHRDTASAGQFLATRK